MTKLGTPIGAGPKGAIVVVGLAAVGAPPASNCEPPSPLLVGRGWSPPPVALGALTRRVPPPPLESPRSSLLGDAAAAFGWCRRRSSCPASSSPPSPAAFVAAPGSAFVAGRGRGSAVRRGSASSFRRWRAALPGRLAGVLGAFAVGVFDVDEAVAVVVEAVGAGRGLERDAASSRRCRGRERRSLRDLVGAGHRAPRAVSASEAGDEHDDRCDLGSHPIAPRCLPTERTPRPLPPHARRGKLPTRTGVRNARGPQHGLNQRLPDHACSVQSFS